MKEKIYDFFMFILNMFTKMGENTHRFVHDGCEYKLGNFLFYSYDSRDETPGWFLAWNRPVKQEPPIWLIPSIVLQFNIIHCPEKRVRFLSLAFPRLKMELSSFKGEPLWYILCRLFGVDYEDWNYECWDAVHESGGNLKDALYVCGYKNLFQLKWKQLIGLSRKGGDA